MINTKTVLLLSLVVGAAAIGCSNDHRDDRAHARADTTSGAEHRDTRTGTHVTARDTDHDRTPDSVAVRQAQPTAMDQGESASDVEITRQIRAAVTADSSLSFSARNCTIITTGGNVTLRGAATTAEAEAIERHAQHVAGVRHVENDIEHTDHVDHPGQTAPH
jgi:hypothetical protein